MASDQCVPELIFNDERFGHVERLGESGFALRYTLKPDDLRKASRNPFVRLILKGEACQYTLQSGIRVYKGTIRHSSIGDLLPWIIRD